MPTPTPHPTPVTGLRRAGPYRLCLEMASGGMGTVYLGYRPSGSARRFAAVKVIHPHIACDDTFVKMFLDEGEIAARIRHPNVCEVYEVDVREGCSYMAMELIAGETFARISERLHRKEHDPASSAVRIAVALAGACQGLHAAHELTDERGEPRSVVHRDVTPGNLMLTLDGVPKVLDFGVVAATRKRHRTRTGVLKGKLAYMAPELLEGRAPDRRNDVWSLGVVGWELLTGKRLFRRESDLETLRAIQNDVIGAPSTVREGIPEALDAVILRALARDPADRFATAKELGRALTQAAMAEEVITSAELADWMADLFPGGRERSHHRLDLCAQLAARDSDETMQLDLQDLTLATEVGPVAPRQPDQSLSTARTSSPPAPSRPPVEPTPPPATKSTTWKHHPLVAAFAGGVIALGSAWLIQLVGNRPEASAADAPPRALDELEEPPPPPSPRIQAGDRLEIGLEGYVLAVGQGAGNELVLRIRRSEGADLEAGPPAIETVEADEDLGEEAGTSEPAARARENGRSGPRTPAESRWHSMQTPSGD